MAIKPVLAVVSGDVRGTSLATVYSKSWSSLAFYCLNFNKKSDPSVRQVRLLVIAIREREGRGKTMSG